MAILRGILIPASASVCLAFHPTHHHSIRRSDTNRSIFMSVQIFLGLTCQILDSLLVGGNRAAQPFHALVDAGELLLSCGKIACGLLLRRGRKLDAPGSSDFSRS